MNKPSILLAALAALAPFSGLSAQSLIANSDFASGLSSWITGCSHYNASGSWLSYSEILPGSGSIIAGGNSATLSRVPDSAATFTEALLFQSAPGRYFQTGDVIHFTGSYTVSVTTNGSSAIRAQFFIEALNPYNTHLDWTTYVNASFDSSAGKTTSGTFEFTARVGATWELSAIHVGAGLYMNDASDSATLKVWNLHAWLNDNDSHLLGESVAGEWAGFAIDPSGYVDTGAWLGWVYPSGNWVWSCRFERWMYLPEWYVRTGGSWMYVME
jgi:hypothetical protein